MVFPASRRVAIVLCCCALLSTAARAAEMRGQVTDAASGLPVEGAAVALTNGASGYAADTDPFGFYAITGIAAGTYTATVSHAGYFPAGATNVIGASDGLHANFALAPALGGEGAGFDILFQVTDAGSGTRLRDVPVTAERFELPGDTAPTQTVVLVTDANGFTVARGMRTGYYRFKANVDGTPRPRWESYTTEGKTNDKTYLIKDHMANFMLKPGPLQDFTVVVKGFDPVLNTPDVPLEGFFVEITGRDPSDPFSVVRPPETGITDTNGAVTFKNLPALPLGILTKKIGYGPRFTFVNPTNAAADLLPNPLTVTNSIDPSLVNIWLTSPYGDARMMTGLVVTVRGLKDTDTEGIFRATMSEVMGPKTIAAFPNLIPGRYRVSVHAPKTSPVREAMECSGSLKFTAHFNGEAYFDHQGQPFKEVPLPLDPMRATVRVRLFAADEQGRTASQLEGDPAERPVYKLRQQDNVRFIEHYFDPLLLPGFKTNIVATGPDGEATLSIVPGCYGVAIPGMTNHTGCESLYRDNTVASVVDGLGWPYPVWTDTYTRVLGRHACGLLFDSGHDYTIDLFTRKRQVDLHGDVDGDAAAPTTFRILANPVTFDEVDIHYSEIANNGGQVSLDPAVGPTVTTNLNDLAEAVDGSGAGADYNFHGVQAGTYGLEITQSQHANMTGAVTIGAWSAPGELPAVPPLSAGDVEALTTVEIPVQHAVYDTTNTVTLNAYRTNGVGGYQFELTTTIIDVAEPPYAPGMYFSVSGTSPSRLPDGTYEFWRNFPPFGWYHTSANGTVTNTVYFDGPLQNVDTNDAPPIPGYTLNVIARSADDPDLVVSNVAVSIPNAPVVTSAVTLTSYTNGFAPTNATHPMWTWLTSGEKYSIDIDSYATPEFTLTLWMKRGMGVSGTVVNADFPSIGVSNVFVIVRDRFGRKLRDAVTASNGAFKVATSLPAGQTVFADIVHPGFQPWRARFVPNPGAASTDLVVSAQLKPIPPPAILSAAFDRYGVFLPGVQLSGSQTLYDGLSADAQLTVTWTASVQQAVFTNQVPDFDRFDGTTGALQTVIMTDDVTEVWLVDQRTFATNQYNDAPVTSAPPAASNGAVALRTWLQSASSTSASNRFMQRITTPVTNGLTAGADAVGQAKVYSLPPGVLDPCFIVLTRQGSAALLDYDFPSPTNQYGLRGLRLPPWMAAVADVLSVVAGTQKTAEELEGILPEGRFEALPEFTSDISEEDGFLAYTYDMSVNWNEGMDTPASGLLALAPGKLGLTFEGNMNFKVDGLNGNASMDVTADLTTDDIELTEMMPKIAGGDVEASGKLKVGASSTFQQNFTQEQDVQFELTHEVGGGFHANAKVNLQPVLGKIPYAGPVLTALDKIEGLQFHGLLQGGIGQESEVRWTTYYPPAGDQSSIDTNLDKQVSRHLLGGDDEFYINQRLCFQFGAGVSVEAAGGRAGASGTILLQGNECGRQPEPSASISFNPYPDWPPIKRVEGNATAVVEAFLKAWVIEVGKSWEWELISFDVQFGTEPLFQLIEMDVSKSRITPATATPALFDGEAPLLAGNFYDAGSLVAVGGATRAMSFTDIDSLSSSMVVKVSTWNGTNWNAPSSLAATGGIVSLAIGQMQNGGWVAAWNEMDHDQVGLPFPSTRLMYATSDVAAASWSTPSLIASLVSTAAPELRLVRSGPFFGLLSLETGQGPLSDAFTLNGRVWNGTGWDLPGGSTTSLTVHGFDAAGADTGTMPRVKIAYTDGAGTLTSIAWNGTNFAAAVSLTNDAGNALGLGADTNGTFLLAWSGAYGGIGLYLCSETGGWVNAGTVFTNGLPLELRLSSLVATGGERFLAAWTEGGAAQSIGYGFLDATGGVSRAADNLTRNEVGRYHGLSVLPSTNWTAEIVALFTASPTQVREFTVGLNEGGSLNDVDGDGFNDLLELVLIDADEGDGVTNLNDVLPGGDFDGDGQSNFDEFYLGLNATDPESVFEVQEFNLTNKPAFFFYAQTNRTYWLQRSATLLDTNAWTDVHSVTGDADFISAVDTNATTANLHYRIRTPIPSPSP